MQEFSRDDFREKLRAARKQKYRSQEQFCRDLGIKRSNYARYETDTLPPFYVLYRICKLLNVSADYLLEPNQVE